ncbi:394_t:CDS:1, partial [Funneliformis geosporum]
MSEDATMDTAVAATIPATANLEPRNTKRITESSPTYTVIQRKIAKHLHLSPLLVAEITRTLFSMLAFVIVGFSCTFAIQSSDYRWKTSGDDMMALVDLGFKVIPYTEQLFLADLFMLTLLV